MYDYAIEYYKSDHALRFNVSYYQFPIRDRTAKLGVSNWLGICSFAHTTRFTLRTQ
jgi:hypothetical protein